MPQRSKATSNLPAYVYRDKSRGTYYRPYLGRDNGKNVWGARVWLADYDAPASHVWKQYESLHEYQQRDVRWILNTYLESKHVEGLAAKTVDDYRINANTLITAPLKGSGVFGDVSLDQVTKRVLRRYLDTYPHPYSANRQVSLLKAAWTWADQRYEGLPDNPCIGVTPNKEEARTRYVTDTEYDDAYARATPWLRVAMELAYLCRGRRGEILSLTTADITSSGLYLKRTKGSEDEVTVMTPRLEAALALSEKLPGESDYLVRNKKGKIGTSAFNSAWRRLGVDWTFHDLKAKGYSDQKVQDAGHRSERMHRTYSRKARDVMPAD